MSEERVLLLHTQPDEGADPSTADVLAQVTFVQEACAAAGIPCRTRGVPLEAVASAVPVDTDEVVFALLETPPGKPHLQAAATAVLELSGVPFTGAGAAAIWLTTDKLATRGLLAAEGIAVAPGGRLTAGGDGLLHRVPPPWIVKPAWEDASLGLDGNAVAYRVEEVHERARELAARFPAQPLLVEHLLPGREFNVSLLEVEGVPRVLPVAEMDFSGLPAGEPPIVSYEAKWLEDHIAYRGTVRTFPKEDRDGPLLAAVRAVAVRAWEVTGLSGYARVDIRLDEAGTPCVLEVNANPCLAADAGFVAAARQWGFSPAETVRHILAAARRRQRGGTT